MARDFVTEPSPSAEPKVSAPIGASVSRAAPLKVLDLFSGIGGFSLGLERTGGFETVAFCEIEPFCRRVLAKHWPEVPAYDDVRTLTAERLGADGICVDVICGGFPCQDISNAGKGEGIAGERSGLWSEIARLAGDLRPAFVIVENVSALLGRGLGTVLGDLASLGYDAEWHCIPASAVGAPHQRDRLWLVAYPNTAEWWEKRGARQRLAWSECLSQWQEGPSGSGPSSQDVAFALRDGSQRTFGSELRGLQGGQRQPSRGPGHWRSEPDVGRVANGVPGRVDRLKSLGNAVVPQIPELIGHAILAARARDEPPKGEDAQAAEGRSPARAVNEVDAPVSPPSPEAQAEQKEA